MKSLTSNPVLRSLAITKVPWNTPFIASVVFVGLGYGLFGCGLWCGDATAQSPSRAVLSEAPVEPAGSAQNATGVASDGWRFDLHAPPTVAAKGMVVTADRYASEVGLNVLVAGGNAVDAAVATALALAVTYPTAGNLGGGGFMVIRLADGKLHALDFRETAPSAATRDMFLDPSGNLTDRSLLGPLAAGVPGSPMGLWQAHRRLGRLPWKALVKPAIRLAEQFEVHPSLHQTLSAARKKLDHLSGDQLAPFAATLRKFYPDDKPLPVGTPFRQADLAETLQLIADHGADGFYRGKTAQRIVAMMERHGGIISMEDLAGYQAQWRDPIVFRYRDHTIVSMPPVSSGGVTMGEIAKILEGFSLGQMKFDSADRVHLLAEAMKRAFCDRNYYLGDPAFIKMPLEAMISEDYTARRRADITMNAATPAENVGPGLGPADFGTDTTHFSIVDDQGNAVALTTTINTAYGSMVTVEDAGFLLNNEMDDFAAKPGHPNAFGLVQGEANAVQPGKRMLSSMTPTIVLDPQGELLLVTGSPGGSTIITSVFQSISNLIDHELSSHAIVAAPRVHHQHLPDRILVEEKGFSQTTIDELRHRGHAVETIKRLGDVQIIHRQGDGTLHGIADPRGYGVARGF